MDTTTKSTGTPPAAPGPEVVQGLDSLALRTEDPGTGGGNTAPPAAPQTETVDWMELVRGGMDILKANAPNWVWPDKPVNMIVKGLGTILNRLPAEQVGALLEKWGPYLLVGGGILGVLRANTETVEIDGQQRRRIRPLQAEPEPKPVPQQPAP